MSAPRIQRGIGGVLFTQREWIFQLRERMVVARFEPNGTEGGIITSYRVVNGPSQFGLRIAVDSKEEACQQVEELLIKLMGNGW